VNPWLYPLRFSEFLPFPPKPSFFELIQNRKENLWIWEKKTLWELVPCAEVTLVSKFHSILCLIAQKSMLEKKCSVLWKNCAQFWANRTSPGLGWTSPDWVFSLRVVHCFYHILLTVCSIGPILFPLHSYLQRDHFYTIGWCVHHILAGFYIWGLNLGHRPILAKEFD
jgi:hypothetical protein